MCNAKKLKEPNLFAEVARRFGSPIVWPNGHIRNLQPKDIARPTNVLPVLRPIDPSSPSGGMEVVDMRWWMVPFFHKGPDVKAWKAMCTNARAEEIAGKPTFREPYRKRRGVAIVDGFYEWTQGAPTPKPRWLIERADTQPMVFPIVWDTWRGTDDLVNSYALLTTAAGEGMSGIHDRQPVILEEDEVLDWLDLSKEPAGGYRGSDAGHLKLSMDGVGFDRAT